MRSPTISASTTPGCTRWATADGGAGGGALGGAGAACPLAGVGSWARGLRRCRKVAAVRPVYASVRLAVAVVAVTAAAGCVSVGGDAGGKVRPSHSAGRRAGTTPDGGTEASGGITGRAGGGSGGSGGHGAGHRPGGDGAVPSAAASSSVAGSVPAASSAGRTEPSGQPGPGVPVPQEPAPSGTSAAPPSLPPEPSPSPSSSAEPTQAEPPPSASEGGAGTQLDHQELVPEPERVPRCAGLGRVQEEMRA
jgi:hypothetical protein